MGGFMLVLVFNLLLLQAKAFTVNNDDSQINKHEKAIPKKVQNLTDTLTEKLREQCITNEQLKHQYRQQDNLFDPIGDGRQPNGLLKFTATKQSSTYPKNGQSRNAVDGNKDTYWTRNSCSHTFGSSQKEDNNIWWIGALGHFSRIDYVSITNRGDCCGERLSNFRVEGFVLDPSVHTDATPKVCKHYTGSVGTGTTETISCDSPIEARYLRVIKYNTKIDMQICEIEAVGEPMLDPAIFTTTIQSSGNLEEIQSRAWRAQDKTLDSCSQTDTNENSDPWWQMDLGETTTVQEVSITNRKDERATWLRGITVTLFENLPTSCTDETAEGTTCATHDTEVGKGETLTLKCNGQVSGRYLRITKKKQTGEALSLCEVAINNQ